MVIIFQQNNELKCFFVNYALLNLKLCCRINLINLFLFQCIIQYYKRRTYFTVCNEFIVKHTPFSVMIGKN